MHKHTEESMLSVETALSKVLELVDPLEPELSSVQNTLGQVLSEDIASNISLPPFDNSAMDGYAVQSSDTSAASKTSPVLLKVVGQVSAGELPKHSVSPGTAIRIMTGAQVPKGANAIVPFEETDEKDRVNNTTEISEINITTPSIPNAHVRPAGQDVLRGTTVLRKGTQLRPPDISIIASIGIDKVQVVRRPIVSILSTGNELTEPGVPLSKGLIYDSNSYGLAAEVKRAGGIPQILGIAKDNIDSINHKIDQSLSSDMLISSAGVSKGDYDMVKNVLALRGKIEFWSVRMRPAKPFAFGLIKISRGKYIPHLGFPGNPVSSMVAFAQFGKAAIRKMMGFPNSNIPTVEAILEDGIENIDGRRVYARVIVTKRNGTYYARSTGYQGSNIITSMVAANGLAICPEHVNHMKAGEKVCVQMLDWEESFF